MLLTCTNARKVKYFLFVHAKLVCLYAVGSQCVTVVECVNACINNMFDRAATFDKEAFTRSDKVVRVYRYFTSVISHC